MNVLVAGWIGSSNLGDELVFAGLRTAWQRAGGQDPLVALSVDPAGTRRDHGVEAVPAGSSRAVLAAIRAARGLVFGGGGLVQDETSWFNLPYHLARPALARLLRRPTAAVGLGAGPLELPGSSGLVRAALRRSVATTARDEDSAALLRRAGLAAEVGADLAWQLDAVEAAAGDRLAVCLRPWTGRRGRLPVAARRATVPSGFVEAMAEALDGLVGSTGLGCHFVAVGGPGDDALHRSVAERMRAPATSARPGWASLAGELATARATVSMRYHGGVASILAGRPVVLLAYSPKVPALGEDLGAGVATTLPWEGAAGALPAAVGALLESDGAAVSGARARLRARGEAEVGALRRLTSALAR